MLYVLLFFQVALHIPCAYNLSMHLPIVIGTVPFRRANYLIQNPRAPQAFDRPGLSYVPAPPPPYSQTSAPPPPFESLAPPMDTDEGSEVPWCAVLVSLMQCVCVCFHVICCTNLLNLRICTTTVRSFYYACLTFQWKPIYFAIASFQNMLLFMF